MRYLRQAERIATLGDMPDCCDSALRLPATTPVNMNVIIQCDRTGIWMHARMVEYASCRYTHSAINAHLGISLTKQPSPRSASFSSMCWRETPTQKPAA